MLEGLVSEVLVGEGLVGDIGDMICSLMHHPVHISQDAYDLILTALEITQAKSRRQPLKMHCIDGPKKMHDLECMSCYCHGNHHKILKYHIKRIPYPFRLNCYKFIFKLRLFSPLPHPLQTLHSLYTIAKPLACWMFST